MKKIRIGINGVGRIGRAIARIAEMSDDIEIKVLNDRNPDIGNISYLLEYDSTYGRFHTEVTHSDGRIFFGKSCPRVYHKSDIREVPWDEHDVDVVIDSSGVRANLEGMMSMTSKTNVKHFLVTNAPNSDIKTIIFGVNEQEFSPATHKVISTSICDTISLAPIIKLIQSTHQIESGYLTTLHPWLSYQNLVDGPSVSWSQPGDIFSHYALGRTAVQNIIPKSTSAVAAADFVFPGLSTKLQSFSFRVPTPIVSSSVLVVYLDHAIDKEDLLQRFYEFEKLQKVRILKNSVKPLTSIDYCKDDHSVIIDHRWTKVERDRHLKLVYWYDNEWGYSSRVVDTLKLIKERYS